MMQACRRAAGALASTSLPADTLRASLPAACQRLYHKNVRCPAGARAAPTRSGCAARPDVTCWSLLAALWRVCCLCVQVVDHYDHPRNVGSFDKTDVSVGTGLVGAPACGDVMKLQIKARRHRAWRALGRRLGAAAWASARGAQVDGEGNIVDSCFKTFGCGSAIASSSVATEWVKGRSIDDVRACRPSLAQPAQVSLRRRFAPTCARVPRCCDLDLWLHAILAGMRRTQSLCV